MERQVILQTAKKLDLTQKSRDEYDIFAGISSPINSPYNLFLRLGDLKEESKNLIYFYAYSLGKQRAIIWGIYNEISNEFLIDSACQYDLEILNTAMVKWKENQYQIVSTETKDKFSTRISLYHMFDDRKDEVVKVYNKFKLYYMYNAVLKRRLILDDISEDLIKQGVIRLVDDFKINPDREFLDEFDDLILKIKGYSSTILKKEEPGAISIQFYEEMTKRLLENKSLNYIKLLLFVFTLMDVEEYRIAKYIIKETEPLKSYIDGSFIGLWLQDVSVTLSKELQSTPKDILVILSKKIIDIFEPKVNRMDITITLPENLLKKLETLSQRFLMFLEKSIYTKESYVRDLEICYSPVECKGDECGLYQHGSKMQSKHDMT